MQNLLLCPYIPRGRGRNGKDVEGYIMTLKVAKTKYEHIVLDEKEVPIVAGTNMKVIELVLEKTAYGWSPEELHFQHPYLS